MALTLRDLRYFVAVADELNMTRAAARLHLSQPALSAALQRLEREVGVSLLQRHGRGVALTAAGEAFVSKARIVLARADDAVETMKDAPASASIVLGFLAPVHEVAGRAVKAFRDTHAYVDVRWEPLDVVDQLSLLHSASVDVAFVWESQDDPDIKFATIATESRAVLLAQD
jgi:DNA-binding transcriptional LysR family regulator